MKVFIPVLLIGFFILSCNQKTKVDDLPKTDYLSKWFMINEDSLHVEFMNMVKKDPFVKPRNNHSWQERAYLPYDSTYMGRFIKETKKYCDSIVVTFNYTNTDPSEIKIALSVDGKKKFALALDTILNLPVRPKYFKIQKEGPPGGGIGPGTFQFDNGIVDLDSLSGEIENTKSPYNITIFIARREKNPKLLAEMDSHFIESLFGLELLNNKIGTVSFEYSGTLNPGLLTIKQLGEELQK